MPKIPVDDKGDYYLVDGWEHLYTFQYRETRKQFEELNKAGFTIYERMSRRIGNQIPEDFWMLGVEESEWGEDFITIKRFWAHKHHHRYCAKTISTQTVIE